MIEAIFLFRAYRTTLAQFCYTAQVKTSVMPHVTGPLNVEMLIKDSFCDDETPADLTRDPFELPADHALRLQALVWTDEGFTLGLAYSTQRGFGRTLAFVGARRGGDVPVEVEIQELGIFIEIGRVKLMECETGNQSKGTKTEPPKFTRGYGLVFGRSERKAISMRLVDCALRAGELGEEGAGAPAHDPELVLSHGGAVRATGFPQYIKLPHYLDLQAELERVRMIRRMRSRSGRSMSAPVGWRPRRRPWRPRSFTRATAFQRWRCARIRSWSIRCLAQNRFAFWSHGRRRPVFHDPEARVRVCDREVDVSDFTPKRAA